MNQSRKPRIFLSHSKKDVEFIHRLEKDLRTCLCDPWIDEIEIRHGRPWLDEVFSTGIPSCEILLCYITENSINSSVVKQELDARLLERLQTDRVTLLIYVDSEASRSKLRLDIQRLHAPILNTENYESVLPRVVAEIWRSYTEHYVASAIQYEKVKRLEAELRIKELEQSQSHGIFSPSEDNEYSIIWRELCRELILDFSSTKIKVDTIGGMSYTDPNPISTPENSTTFKMLLDFGVLFRSIIATQKYSPSPGDINFMVASTAANLIGIDTKKYNVNLKSKMDIEMELLRYGLLERQAKPPPNSNNSSLFSGFTSPFRVVFTSKHDRFLFWLDQNIGEFSPTKKPLLQSINA
jgi:TIR domain